MTRSTVLEVLREDYIRTAWAKGLAERAVVIRHALKNSMLPVITLIGTEFAFLIGGLVVTETVFTLNGVGRFVVDAVAHRDYPVVQALIFLIAFGFVVVNLLVDLTYAWFDPRIRYPLAMATNIELSPHDGLGHAWPRSSPSSKTVREVRPHQAARRRGRVHHPRR